MSTYSLFGNKVSLTYQRLLQIADGGDPSPSGIIYDGFGNVVYISDVNLGGLRSDVEYLLTYGVSGVGFQGFQGINGEQGFQGLQGINGEQGLQGFNALDGFGSTNSVPKYLTPLSFTNSNISDNGTVVSISTDATINSITIGRGPGNISSNVVLGQDALFSNIIGNNNVAIGQSALFWGTASSNNTAIGYFALINAGEFSDASDNVGIGANAGRGLSAGNFNTLIGRLVYGDASINSTASNNNTAIGYRAGYLNKGSNNVFIGYDAGYNEAGSDKLYISNTSTSTPLIFGDFATQSLGINGRVCIGGNTSSTNSILELNSTTRAFRPPIMTTAQINSISSPTAGMVAYSSDENVLMYYDSEWGWWSDNVQWRAKNGIDIFEDFLGGYTRATLGSIYSPLFMLRVANSAVIRQSAGGSNRTGVIKFSTSTTSNAQSGAYTDDILGNGYLLGGGKILVEMDVQFPILSDGTNTYRWWGGFSNNIQAVSGNGVSSVSFFYDANNVFGYGGSANWQVITSNNNSRSITVTSIPVNAGQWYRLRIIINSNATQVHFLIDGSNVRTETNNIPATTIQLGLGCNLMKSAGTTERNLLMDFFRIKQKFTTQR